MDRNCSLFDSAVATASINLMDRGGNSIITNAGIVKKGIVRFELYVRYVCREPKFRHSEKGPLLMKRHINLLMLLKTVIYWLNLGMKNKIYERKSLF